MPYFVTKTGLEAFDVARAWGLAVLLNVLTEDEVEIRDTGWAFALTPKLRPGNSQLQGLAWRVLFAMKRSQSGGMAWDEVFVTSGKQKRQEKINKVKRVLQEKWQTLCNQLQNPTNIVELGIGENLPGGLDPIAFKGLRHYSRARYDEDQLKVSEQHWALACLGMAACGVYHRIREAGQRKTLALLPIPKNATFNYFRDVQALLRVQRLNYCGVQNAAAHYAVYLAEQLRRRAAAQGDLQDHFHAILYFTLFGAGQQIKPSQGSQLNLAPLMEAIQRDPHGSQTLFQWLDYCFRLGATRGAEELALATTELVMRWDLDSYERLVRVLVRFIAQKRIKRENLPSEETLREVMRHVAA